MDYDTRLNTLEYGMQTIGTIVNNEKECHVLAIDPVTGKSEFRKVLRYFKNKATPSLKISHDGGGSFKCTTNHGIFIYLDGELEKVPADYVELGDYLVQTVTSHKSTHLLNNEWKPIFLGLILGDGCLAYPHNTSSSVRLTITHGEDQGAYFAWKQSLLETAGLTNVESHSGYSDKSVHQFTTKSFVDYDNWKPAMYSSSRSGSKVKVPAKIATLLTKESWAIMYQDDGSSSNNNCLTFSFCELDIPSCENLVESLKKVFNVTAPVIYTCNKGFNYIRLNKNDSLLFKNSIKSLVHPSMYYKLVGVDLSDTIFSFNPPNTTVFNEHFALRKVTSIEPVELKYGYRYNIEVEDVHTYFANGILVSNCHHVSASTFSDIVDSSYARYRIGLSGTLERKDGKHIVFRDYFGSTIHRPPQSHTLDPTVRLVKSGVHLTGDNWAQKINNLLYDEDYQKFIAALAKIQIDRGYKVLIVAERVEFLNNIKEQIGSDCVLITGETPFDERKALIAKIENGEASCIAGSRQIFTEGISVNPLSCVILASPTSNRILLEQLIGRIMRLWPGKLHPIVFDILFASYAERKQNEMRQAFYLSKGWHIENFA